MNHKINRRDTLALGMGLGGLALGLSTPARAAGPLKEVRLDYAYYSPTSLVLRRFGWLEEDFKADGVSVKWVLSAGSNRALEYLNADSIDIGSTAGLAALLARANGSPIRTPYIYSGPSGPRWWCAAIPTSAPWRT